VIKHRSEYIQSPIGPRPVTISHQYRLEACREICEAWYAIVDQVRVQISDAYWAWPVTLAMPSTRLAEFPMIVISFPERVFPTTTLNSKAHCW